jgi:hypothetical protein
MTTTTNLISAAVGVAAPNRADDVRRIQAMLNALPAARGGPQPLLQVDGACGPLTCAAIRRFQSQNLGFADGTISPGMKTITALVALLQSLGLMDGLQGGGGAPAPAPAPGQENGAALGPTALREKIRLWALMCTQGPYGAVGAGAKYGIVSDADTLIEGGRTVRRGWKNLKSIFEDTVVGWTENHWKAPHYLDGVRIPGWRVPQTGKEKVRTEGISWCGIFATWCWIKSGKASKWMAGAGPTGAQRVSGRDGIQVGDICVQNNQWIHHFVAVDVRGDTIMGVNGNSDFQSILLKPMPRSSVGMYYRPD